MQQASIKTFINRAWDTDYCNARFCTITETIWNQSKMQQHYLTQYILKERGGLIVISMRMMLGCSWVIYVVFSLRYKRKVVEKRCTEKNSIRFATVFLMRLLKQNSWNSKICVRIKILKVEDRFIFIFFEISIPNYILQSLEVKSQKLWVWM